MSSATIFSDPIADVVQATLEEVQHKASYNDADEVVSTRNTLGHKFTDMDVTPELEAIARRYLAAYTGNSGFVLSVKTWARNRRISPKQVAGVLNVLYVEIVPKPIITTLAQADPVRYADEDDVSYEAWLDHISGSVGKGTYTVVLPLLQDRVTVRLGGWRPDTRNAGKTMRWISFRQGASYTLYAKQPEGRQHVVLPRMRGSHGLVNTALSVLFNDPDEVARAALAYAMESGRCARCDKQLTVPASIHQGYGPECVKYVRG
jgi:hypothetical protein